MLFTPNNPALPTNPLGEIIGIVQAILQILGLGGPNLQVLETAINNTWANLAVGASFLYNAIGYLTDFIKKFISIVATAIKHILSDIIHGHLLNVLKDLQKMFHQLQDLFGPILQWIQKIRDWFYKYVYKYIKLVQDILQTIRVILSAFRLLGVKWAAKLDADIARIQGYITTVLQDIVGTLNQAATWIQFAVDPIGIIRTGVMRDSVFNAATTISRALNFGKNRYLTASESDATQGDRAMLGGGAAVLTRNQDGSVTYSDASKRINAGYDTAWKMYGGTTAIH